MLLYLLLLLLLLLLLYAFISIVGLGIPPFPVRKMPCGIRRRQTLNRPCVCVHCVYLTNTTIRKATTTTTVPQSGKHVVYFDLYPSPPVDPPPTCQAFLVCPFLLLLQLQLKLVKHFILIKLGAHIRRGS